MNELNIIGRKNPLFRVDIDKHERAIKEIISESRFLVIGGAGTIGQAVTNELFKRDPLALHVVDISENSTVELVRNLRSTIGYNTCDFKTYAIDANSIEFQSMIENQGPYDYVFNLSALKHVRSEKDPYTLMRMIDVNIFNTIETLRLTNNSKLKKYFCVSTDKAANPVNMMGASKLIMEIFMSRESIKHTISMARFANVAFSDGSLLHGFNQRFIKKQPISAPVDILRYFVTAEESGELCMMSGLLGENKDIFFPKLGSELELISFSDIAKRYIRNHGYDVFECQSEDEARVRTDELISKKLWPCYFFKSDTTGEKGFEEFFTKNEEINSTKFMAIGIIKKRLEHDDSKLIKFEQEIKKLKKDKKWSKEQILELFNYLIPDFSHKETGKYLDGRM
tara:strand:- start:129 stop:1316 length:1188 start_codon:yes stop_codon:yes gene_type:complete